MLQLMAKTDLGVGSKIWGSDPSRVNLLFSLGPIPLPMGQPLRAWGNPFAPGRSLCPWGNPFTHAITPLTLAQPALSWSNPFCPWGNSSILGQPLCINPNVPMITPLIPRVKAQGSRINDREPWFRFLVPVHGSGPWFQSLVSVPGPSWSLGQKDTKSEVQFVRA